MKQITGIPNNTVPGTLCYTTAYHIISTIKHPTIPIWPYEKDFHFSGLTTIKPGVLVMYITHVREHLCAVLTPDNKLQVISEGHLTTEKNYVTYHNHNKILKNV